MQRTENVCGLPWLHSKPERKIFDELKFACVYAVGPSGGRPLRIGWARQLKDRMQDLQLGSWKELAIHDIAWVAGDMLAIRIFNEAVQLVDRRRLHGDWFDITPEFASQALRIAAEKSGVPTLSHGQMLDKVASIRKNRIDAAVRKAS
jgi:hypothetical protein